MATDYFISARRMDKDNKHIESVRVHPNANGKPGEGSSWRRQRVIDAIDDGKVFRTWYKKPGASSKSAGVEVEVVTIERKPYLKTKRNSTKADNLDGLPPS